MGAWCLPAFAKINLGLRILGKRNDGYHELETAFLQIGLADRLFFEKISNTTSPERATKTGLSLSCNRADVPVDASNLCSRAHQLMSQAAGDPLSIRLHVEKNIPVGAGLGGGSSDAAVTLIALNCLFDLGWSTAKLQAMAMQLGSDVPFFLIGGFCLGRGRGEMLTPLPDLPDFNILIITPSLMVSTAWAYQNYKIGLTKKQKNSTLSSFKFDHLTRHQLVDLCQNDLEAGVFEAHPELALIKSRLLQCGALVASMTGSGSAVYGIFRTLQEAQRGQRFFEKEYATHVTKPVRWGIREVYQNYETLTSGG